MRLTTAQSKHNRNIAVKICRLNKKIKTEPSAIKRAELRGKVLRLERKRIN